MVLPTKVNFINDSNERVKIKFTLRGGDSFFNLEPGENRRISGSNWGTSHKDWDIVADIIINPNGPDNNTSLGGFYFHNPTIGPPYVGSKEFYFLERKSVNLAFDVYYRGSAYYKTTWGKKVRLYTDDLKYNADGLEPFPIFDIEAFPQDVGAKEWDLHIKKVSGPEGFSALENPFSRHLAS